MIEKWQTAKAPGKLGKKPKVIVGKRNCNHFGCITILSMYNKEAYCWRHQPRKIPRLRGSPKETVLLEVRCVECMDRLAEVTGETTETWLGAMSHWRISFNTSTLCSLPCGEFESESAASN